MTVRQGQKTAEERRCGSDLDPGRCFCRSDDAFHAVQEAQPCELSQHNCQNSVNIVCEHMLPHALTCSMAKRSNLHFCLLYSSPLRWTCASLAADPIPACGNCTWPAVAAKLLTSHNYTQQKQVHHGHGCIHHHHHHHVQADDEKQS